MLLDFKVNSSFTLKKVANFAKIKKIAVVNKKQVTINLKNCLKKYLLKQIVYTY